ncbi:MAG: phospholipid carrier-dependent glycosyltransferase, partial [Nanoarchaeota archaeon]|nr:phospholipid carrier-dependent glycosyltransferase [Nanoarchaeota archaeon]
MEKLIKNKAHLIALAFILLFGIYLRWYHVEYPVIGYHNWKAEHYLSEAKNFAREGFFKYGFFVPMRDTTESVDEESGGAHNDTFPTISIIVGFFFMLFGENLALARVINILFSIGTVAAFYFLIKKLFEKEILALLSALLMAINPMYVFFSHNVDVINPGVFFMVLGAYLYVSWHKRQTEIRTLYFAAFAVVMAIITKYTFVVIVFPILATFPYKKFMKKENFKQLAILGGIASIFPLWFTYSELYVKKYIFGRALSANVLDSYEITKLIDFSVISDVGFWNTMNYYLRDNFTIIGIWFSIIGMVLFIYLFFQNNEKFGYRFTLAYLASLILFVIVMGFKLSGHSYHQFPVGPLIIFMMAYFIYVIGFNLENLTKVKHFSYIFTIIMVFVAPLPSTSVYARSI